MRILLVEDDTLLGNGVCAGLRRDDNAIDWVKNGETALSAVLETQYDCIILDIGLPKMSGLDVLKKMRGSNNDTPVLILTAQDELSDRVKGLDAGADDYLVKPFALNELLARVRALIRRARADVPEILSFETLRLDTGTHQAFRKDRVIDLTAKEYELLELFLRHPRQVLTRDQIFDRVWGYDFGGESNIIEVYVRYLRQKSEANEEPRLIHTVRGVGYVLREQA